MTDHYRRACGLLISRLKHPAQLRRNSEDLEVVTGDHVGNGQLRSGGALNEEAFVKEIEGNKVVRVEDAGK